MKRTEYHAPCDLCGREAVWLARVRSDIGDHAATSVECLCNCDRTSNGYTGWAGKSR